MLSNMFLDVDSHRFFMAMGTEGFEITYVMDFAECLIHAYPGELWLLIPLRPTSSRVKLGGRHRFTCSMWLPLQEFESIPNMMPKNSHRNEQFISTSTRAQATAGAARYNLPRSESEQHWLQKDLLVPVALCQGVNASGMELNSCWISEFFKHSVTILKELPELPSIVNDSEFISEFTECIFIHVEYGIQFYFC